MKYYTPLIIIVWLALLILGVLAHENDRFTKEKKKILYVTYALVGAAALFEWLGVQLNGNTSISPWLLRIVKLFDYMLTPLAGGAIILQFQSKSIFKKLIFGVLCANIVFQLVSLFGNWMIYIDESNIYHHGSAYYAYIAFYLIIVVLVIIEFSLHGRNFRKQNRFSLYSILGFAITGIVLQEVLGGQVRTAYICLVVALALLFIHDSEYAQQASDDQIQEQMIKISIDPLTGLFSRHAYTEKIQKLESLDSLPRNLVVFSIDINGLKSTNDNYGHSAGDELICAASDCIKSVFKASGECFRTGGDEFIVFASLEKEEINELVSRLEEITDKWHGKEAPDLSLSIGFAEASSHPEAKPEKLIAVADREMYKAKAEYYQNTGTDRRKN